MKPVLFILLLLVCLVGNGEAQAQNTIDQIRRASLRGLSGVGVVIEDLNKDLESDGVTRDQLRTDVELRLRKAGIKVLTEEANTAGDPFLHLSIMSIKLAPCSGYAYSASLALNQDVTLSRNIEFRGSKPFHPSLTAVATWEKSIMGTVSLPKLRDIRDKLADLLDEFINDYLAVDSERSRN